MFALVLNAIMLLSQLFSFYSNNSTIILWGYLFDEGKKILSIIKICIHILTLLSLIFAASRELSNYPWTSNQVSLQAIAKYHMALDSTQWQWYK